jgi:hypothetical protein
MAVVDIARGQSISIPAIRLSNGVTLSGAVKLSDGENLILEVDPDQTGRIPDDINEMVVLIWEADGLQRSCPFLVRRHGSRELVGQVVVQERREAPRLRVSMRLAFELIEPTRVVEAGEEVMARFCEGESASDTLQMLRKGEDPTEQLRAEVAALRELIGEMMLQLDEVASLVRGEGPAGPKRQIHYALSVLNCSSTGLGLVHSDTLLPGQYLRLQMKLRNAPPLDIECLGVVVRCQKLPAEAGCERYEIGVRFTHIHEADRERMIHYLFKVQRQLLRDRKEARSALAPQR